MSCPEPFQWDTERDGTRTCSYCGSLHPEDMTDIMYRFAQGEPGYKFEPTGKGYKFYANRPGVRNAGDGGIKFYTNHIEDDVAFRAAWELAIARFRYEYEKRWGTRS